MSRTSAERRDAIVEQLGYLVDEVDALGPLLSGLPPDVPTMHLPGERSLLGTLAYLAALDRRDLLRLNRMVEEHEPAFEESVLGEVLSADVDAVIRDVRAARGALAAAFAALPPEAWARTAAFPDGTQRDVTGLALTVTQRDADALRRVAHRLHESNLRDL
ncbi:MAG: hypothetical protein AAGI91_12275 [Bacteroidota bacterium]